MTVKGRFHESSEDASSLNHPDEQNNERHNQQDVDEPSQGGTGYKSQDPEDNQDDRYSG
jgi:hypothetical protein